MRQNTHRTTKGSNKVCYKKPNRQNIGRNMLVSGRVYQVNNNGTVLIHLDQVNGVGILKKSKMIPGESFQLGDQVVALVMYYRESRDELAVFLSRLSFSLVVRLFEAAAPDIDNGQVEIKGVAREPGVLSKVSVRSNSMNPISAAIGIGGTIVNKVSAQLHNERIDIVPYSDNIETYLKNLFLPVPILAVKPGAVDAAGLQEYCIYVAQENMSAAIGKNGTNVRLISRLAGGCSLTVISASDE